MASFDKTGKPVMPMKGLEGKPVGQAGPEEIAKAKKHQAELLMITPTVRLIKSLKVASGRIKYVIKSIG